MPRRLVFPILLLLLLAPIAPASAEVRPFDAKAFEEAQAAGQGIVVDVHAPW